jgi:hypothetical protein
MALLRESLAVLLVAALPSAHRWILPQGGQFGGFFPRLNDHSPASAILFLFLLSFLFLVSVLVFVFLLLLPPGYEKSLRTVHDDLWKTVNCAMADLLMSDDVGTLVFLYSDHGFRDRIGPMDEEFAVSLVSSWVTSAVSFGKKLLFVLNSCYSTQFARAVLKEGQTQCGFRITSNRCCRLRWDF